jgi:polysaccharide export outer membrane protein
MIIQQYRVVLCCLLAAACVILSGAEIERSTYVLGPEDEVKINALDVAEIGDSPIRIDLQGSMNVPLIGRIQAGGQTVEQLEAELMSRLRKYVREPHVTVTVSEFRSQPVSVLGSVNKPGVHQLRGRKTLFEVLSLAEGLRNDAGSRIKITRQMSWGKVPLPTAVVDQSQTFSVAEVSVKSVMEGSNPQENILIMPNDVISVPRAEVVYVVGTVKKAGGFVLGEKKGISTLQAVALAEGLDRGAAPQSARIFRTVGESAERQEIRVDLSKVLAGKGTDVPLYADDILFVPGSTVKKAGYRALETAIQLTTGILIWR